MNKPKLKHFMEEHGLDMDELNIILNHIKNREFELNKEMVGPEEFFCSPEYMNAQNVLYPVILDAMIKICSGKYEYEECLLTGGIGAGKSTVAVYVMAWTVYLLSCYKSPQLTFGLDPASELLIVFQSLNATLAKAVDYNRFRALVEQSPYFQRYFPFDKNIESELRFPNRIIVKPVSGEETAAIGQNVISAIIDEINFMEVTEKSRKSIDGGTYNQALALYNSISRRRKSRFMSGGKLPGMICIVSSKRYPGQFTDEKEAEAERQVQETGTSNIYVYDKTIWQVKPWEFSGKTFNLFVGDETRKPRILENEIINAKDKHLINEIPIEYKDEFQRDMYGALRDIAGHSTLSKHPFLMNVEAVSACFNTCRSILSRSDIDFEHAKLKVLQGHVRDLQYPRFVHIDLAVTGDSAGMAMGYVDKFVNINRGDEIEVLPHIVMDFTLEIIPPKGGEIVFSKIRNIIYAFSKLGIPIKWVSFDQFQSRDSMQILQQKGYTVGPQSMERTPLPYEMLKTALYDGRVSIPEHPKLLHELKTLERDAQTGKIDHAVNSSNDIADALAGVVYGLTMRRENWVKHGISLLSIPVSIKEVIKK
jgi:hypothetical protein